MIEMQDINDNIINQIEFIFIDGKIVKLSYQTTKYLSWRLRR